MQLPNETLRLITQFLEEIQSNPTYYLNSQERKQLYESFGATPTFFGWLAIETAKKVLPIWESRERNVRFDWDEGADSFPHDMVETARGILLGKTPVEAYPKAAQYKETWDQEAEPDLIFWDEMTGMDGVTTWPVYKAIDSAQIAFNFICYKHRNISIDGVIESALIAYAGIDKNPPGLWRWAPKIDLAGFEVYLMTEEIIEDLKESEAALMKSTPEFIFWRELQSWEHQEVKNIRNYQPITMSFQKALDFWQWWLIEAIPQAWKLTQQTS